MMPPRVWAKNLAGAMSHTTVISVEDEQEFFFKKGLLLHHLMAR